MGLCSSVSVVVAAVKNVAAAVVVTRVSFVRINYFLLVLKY